MAHVANLQLKTTHTHRYLRPVLLQPSTVPAQSHLVETYAVKQLFPDMFILVNAPDLEAGLILTGANVPEKDTLELKFQNVTDADIAPASQQFWVVAL